MTQHLTAPDPDLDALVKATPPNSMMFWSGTARDKKAMCGACQHYGYPGRCALFFKHAQRHGGRLPADTRACKYFSRKT